MWWYAHRRGESQLLNEAGAQLRVHGEINDPVGHLSHRQDAISRSCDLEVTRDVGQRLDAGMMRA